MGHRAVQDRVSAIDWNIFVASGNQNECSSATALLKSSLTAGAHEVSNVHAGAADLIRRHRAVIFMLRTGSSRQRERTDTNENGHELALHGCLLARRIVRRCGNRKRKSLRLR